MPSDPPRSTPTFRLVDVLVDWLVGWFGWLVGWLSGWLVERVD